MRVPVSPTKPGWKLLVQVHLLLKSSAGLAQGFLAGTYMGYKKGTFFAKNRFLDL